MDHPEVVSAFAEQVGTERRLVALYLLTVADVRGTSPKVWNAWKGKLLEDLFRATRRMLTGAPLARDAALAEKQAEAARLLRLYALSDSVKDKLWAQLDTAYFLRHDAQEIAWQTRNLHYRVDTDKPVVKARLAPFGEGLQVHDLHAATARRCSRASAATSSAPASTSSRPRSTPRATAMRSTPSSCMGQGRDAHYRDMHRA